MIVKDIVDENFQDYKKTSMFICTTTCTGKCWKELGLNCSICQNQNIMQQPSYDIANEKIVDRYMNNNITKAIIIGGLEPFDQFEDMIEFIKTFRRRSSDDIVIYTGYNKSEIKTHIQELLPLSNIIIKYGRYIPNRSSIKDSVLGISLASDNQYAEKIC